MFNFNLSTELLIGLGLLSVVLSVWAYLPYIRDTLVGRTHPQRASWLIWSALSTIAFCALASEGVGIGLWFAGAQMGATVTIFALSISRGQGAFLTRVDERVLWIATIGLVVWYFTETATYALALTITISLAAGTLTVAKAYRAPRSETLSTWVLSFAASCCALLAEMEASFVHLAYPGYLFALNLTIIAAILLGRSRKQARARSRFPQIVD